MRRLFWLLALCMLVICSAALAQQTLTVNKLAQFLHSTTHEDKGKQSDQEIAKFLATVRLSERLDDATIEQLQSEGLGSRTIAALKTLRDRSAKMPAARPVVLTEEPKAPPPPSSQEQAEIIDAVRQYALEYTGGLPDFLCHETMVTYAAPPGAGSGWMKVSSIDSKLSYYKQKEAYAPYMQDGKFTSQEYEKLKGSKSVGDFGTMLRGIFEPATETRFEWRGWAAHEGKRAMEFNYRVTQERSNYTIAVEGGRSLTPGYHGYFQIDPKTHVIWKLTLTAEDLPRDFPVQSADASLEYEYRDLSGKTFLLPSDYQALMSGPDGRNRIDKQFRIYRKYSADSEISFGDEPETAPPVVKK